MKPIRTLHIDIEGGWGGSSRSLFELVSRLDPARIAPVVVHARQGPVSEWYAKLGVRAYHVPTVGSYVPRDTKALKNFIASLPRLARLEQASQRIAAIATEHRTELIHLNYEGLFLMARSLRRLGLPMIGHSRAMVGDNVFGRWLARSLARTVEHMFYISPQEQARFAILDPSSKVPGEVLWNIAPPVIPRRPFGDPPEAVYFGSLDRAKGTDRLIDIAEAMRDLNAPALRIAVYGVARTNPEFEQELASRIASAGLQDRIELRGNCREPMQVMAGALCLIRPSRGDDPWGRDVIEAAAAGLPVLATGTVGAVVRHNQTGFLFSPFDAKAMASRIADLAADRERWKRLSEAAVAEAKRFQGDEQAERFANVVETVAGPTRRAQLGE